jgi:hypothetical protein
VSTLSLGCPHYCPPFYLGEMSDKVRPALVAVEMAYVVGLARDDNIDPPGIYGQGPPSPP